MCSLTSPPEERPPVAHSGQSTAQTLSAVTAWLASAADTAFKTYQLAHDPDMVVLARRIQRQRESPGIVGRLRRFLQLSEPVDTARELARWQLRWETRLNDIALQLRDGDALGYQLAHAIAGIRGDVGTPGADVAEPPRELAALVELHRLVTMQCAGLGTTLVNSLPLLHALSLAERAQRLAAEAERVAMTH